MLKTIQISNRSQIQEIFQGYNPRHQTWLVSDLRTKFELQQQILEKQGQFVDESVLRASDLWKILLKRLDPQIRLVSDPFARSLLRSILDKNSEVLGVNSSAEDTLFAYIDEMAAIVFHPEGTARLDEWFESHPEAQNRWRDWYLRARFCAFKLLQDHRVITADWVTAYLQNFSELERVWNAPLIVDLGGEISRVEAEIIKNLAKDIEMTVIEPVPLWKEDFHFLLKPYDDIRSPGQGLRVLSEVAYPKDKKIEVLRFSGMLAEVKNAVAQVRGWLELGVNLESIAIIAPDIEQYWPVLQSYLKEEGIPTQKDVTQKIQSLPSVTKWMASLRARSGYLSSSDLELSFFSHPESEQLRYEEFKSLFKNLYESEDLNRNEIVNKIFKGELDFRNNLIRDAFVAQALFFWTSPQTDTIEIILRELLQNAAVNTSLSWKEWLSYLESIVAAKEILIEKASARGIVVTKLMSADSRQSQYRIFMGLTDESLKARTKTQLSGKDYFDLGKDLGFYLDDPDQSDLDFELRLISENPTLHDIYSFGATDFSGSICSPSTFWMSLKADHEHLSVPGDTRWDELQVSSQAGQRPSLEGRNMCLEKRLSEDLGINPIENIKMTEMPRLSASALESFLECPFVFAAQRHFKLKDLPDIDLDIDHRTRGQLAHALFEVLTVEPMRFDWSDEELDRMLDQIREEKKLKFADERLWLPLKRRHVQIGQRFLKIEKQWRQEFKKTKTLGRETRFEFFLDPRTEEIHKTSCEGALRFSGQIDRIDGDEEGHLILLDYKSSTGGISSHSSWLKNNELQLLFYMWVIEKKLVENLQGEVLGVFYYIFKNFERKGFRIDEKAGILYPASKRKDKNANFEMKEQYLTAFSQLLMKTVQRIRDGEIQAIPRDTKICSQCEWRRQCRAPHLN